jgi:hypothetical protein
MIEKVIFWSNENSGFISIVLFVLTFLIAWISGVFKTLRNNAEFKIELIDQCSFCCVFDLNQTHQNLPVHKTAFVVYLKITNIGRASSSLGEIKLGYLKSDFTHRLFSKRNWVKELVAKEDFKASFSDSGMIKIYPFLKQRNQLYANDSDTFLQVGKQINGIAYFEENEAFGSWMPRENENSNTTNVKIVIYDAFGKTHSKDFDLKFIEPAEAFKHNNYFGQTLKEYFKDKPSA